MVETSCFQLFSSTKKRKKLGKGSGAEVPETAKLAVVGHASSIKPQISRSHEPLAAASAEGQPSNKTEVISFDAGRESNSAPSGEGPLTAHGQATADLRANDEDVDFKSLGVSPWLCR